MRAAVRLGTGLATALMLAGCGGSGNQEAQNSADALRNAAEQSTPEARNVMLNEAERIEDQNVQLPPGDPNSPVQQALQNAGNAQAIQPPPPLTAQPHKAGDPVPPPKAPPKQ